MVTEGWGGGIDWGPPDRPIAARPICWRYCVKIFCCSTVWDTFRWVSLPGKRGGGQGEGEAGRSGRQGRTEEQSLARVDWYLYGLVPCKHTQVQAVA